MVVERTGVDAPAGPAGVALGGCAGALVDGRAGGCEGFYEHCLVAVGTRASISTPLAFIRSHSQEVKAGDHGCANRTRGRDG